MLDDNARFRAVVLPYIDEAYRLARWLTANGTDAEDVVQDASLRAFRAIRSYAGGNPRAWLLSIVRNTAYSWLRKNRPAAIVSVDDLEAVELEHEEQEMRGGGGDALLYVGVELRARGIDGVAGVDKTGIGREPAEQIIECLEPLHRLGQRRPRVRPPGKRSEPALIGLLEGDTLGIGAIEVAFHPRVIHPGIEVGQIPFRQRAEAGRGTGLVRSSSGGASCWCGHGQ